MTPVPPCNLPASAKDPGQELTSALNRHCHCITVDEPALTQALQAGIGEPGLYQSIREHQPHLFSPTAVYVAHEDIERMTNIIRAVETVVARPRYREQVLRWAPAIAAFDPGSDGVFLGYDFHISPQGPQLIEINTNAGGAALNTALAQAQRACCQEVEEMITGPVDPARLEQTFVDMFRREWRRCRGDKPLATVAIVDDKPAEQYLYPEFRLFEALFRRHGLHAVIADAADLVICHGRLWHGETPIDLVYNRLTDFALQEHTHTALREAYLNNSVVVTPHPRAHALYADKRNLILLTDEGFLRTLELPPATVATLLAGIPRTVAVTPPPAEEFWRTRRQWFFKPAAGFGSRAAYRGDKLTRRVFAEILQGEYVAQAQVDPPERCVQPGATPMSLKFDIRNYVYRGAVQMLAARLYQGQTTNFRTQGGGFAPVFYSPDASSRAACGGNTACAKE
jgi:hypothetical protein